MRKGTAASLERCLRDKTEKGLDHAREVLGAGSWGDLMLIYGPELGFNRARRGAAQDERVSLLVARSKALGLVRAHCARLGC